MRILITGAAGLVGSHLASVYRDEEVAALRHRDLDLTDAYAVEQAVQRLLPALIFNCAVTGVDDCEADPALAQRVNVDGPASLARAAQRTGAAIVHFSTNYVFDGDTAARTSYTIEDEARPINVYGVTKLEGERAVTAAATRAYIVRTSWVFGAGKDSFLSTVADRLVRGERVQAITDTFASATYAGDLVTRVARLIERGQPGTYHVVNEGVCSYESFARTAARLAGVSEEGIETVTEESLRRPAARPRWTPMRCLLSERLQLEPMRSWQEALAEYLRER